MRNCTANSRRTGQPCRQQAIRGTTVCRMHGGSAPQVREAGRRRIAQQAIQQQAQQALTAEGYTIDTADPLTALDQVLTEAQRLKNRLGGTVDKLADDELRYRGRAGEQVRAELAMYVVLLDRVSRIAERILRADLSERRVRIQEAQTTIMAVAIRNTLRQIPGVDTHSPDLGHLLGTELKRAAAAYEAGQLSA